LNPRRIIPILVTIAAHILLLQFFNGSRRPLPAPDPVVPIRLVDVPVITTSAAAKPVNLPKPFRPRPTVKNTITETVASNPEPVIAAEPAPEPTLPTASEMPATAQEIAPLAQVAPTLLTLPPPSANYLLDVVRTEPNVANPYYGSGEIRWEHDGDSYTLHLEVGVKLLFANIRLFSVDSEGSLVEAGIKPKKMTESRRGRSATATHFNYDSSNISFSASTATFPLSDGAQDRATVLMQLASIGNADPGQFQNGKEITIQVAEDKDASPFQFVVLGQETIDTRLGHLATWHIVRPPRPGSYSSRLDVWVAPELNWLPVQIRNTESNGAITTQTIRKIITGIKQ
jgi:hypothetical protein